MKTIVNVGEILIQESLNQSINCKNCNHNFWLHAEMDYNGDKCCDCKQFELVD